ncbi:MAG: excinuclease ABC subunit UvrC [Chlamydiia bacterium]
MNPSFLEELPTKPGVYLMRDADKKVLYIGKAKNLKVRVKQYYSGHDSREMIPVLLDQVEKIETIITLSEKEALILESSLIKQHKPKYNVLLKDDKSFIGILIRDHEKWPMIELVRQKGALKEKGHFFGPFTSSRKTRELFELLTHNFPLRQCSDTELASRKRPCLLHAIKRCLAPCMQLCTQEAYQDEVKGVTRFLRGNTSELIKNYQKQMEKASEELRFEEALQILRKIEQIEHYTENQHSPIAQTTEAVDVVGYAYLGRTIIVVILIFRDGALKDRIFIEKEGTLATQNELLESILTQYLTETPSRPEEILVPDPIDSDEILEELFSIKKGIHVPQKGAKKKLLEMAQENAASLLPFMESKEGFDLLHDLQKTLELTRLPETIECFDTSNLGGSNPTASMVTFVDGKKETKRYRHYKIQSNHGDDYSAMKEVLTRRYSHGDLPDLVIVDGGKGQLGLVTALFSSLEIATVDVIGLAKEQARHDKGLTSEQIFQPSKKSPIILPQGPLLFFLQRIRDEAHRFAISYHKNLRKKRVIASVLDEIEGIGPLKKGRLLKHFKSLSAIQGASLEELQKVQGITKKDAERLHLKLRGKSK